MGERALAMNYQEYRRERMQDPEFREVFIESEGEYQAMRAVYLARKDKGITQQELSALAHVPQKTISQIESGNINTSVKTLAKIAKGMNKRLKIEFV